MWETKWKERFLCLARLAGEPLSCEISVKPWTLEQSICSEGHLLHCTGILTLHETEAMQARPGKPEFISTRNRAKHEKKKIQIKGYSFPPAQRR